MSVPENVPPAKGGPVPPPGPAPRAPAGEGAGFGAAEIVALVLTAVWLAVSGAFVLSDNSAGPADGAIGAAWTVAAVIVPIALIWAIATTARMARRLRQERQSLQATIDALRQAYIAQSQAQAAIIRTTPAGERAPVGPAPTFSTRRDTRYAPVVLTERAPATAPLVDQAAADEQPALALGTRAEDLQAPVPAADLIRALNFPDSGNDKEGFRALRAALEDRDMARLIRAAQDVLTLLSQDGIYMDDLAPDRARPEIWRRFAQGERGRTIAALGGVRDRSSLALSAARMRQDTIFRDATHHFLRQFDRSFSAFEKRASDADIAALAETRTARAFMLLGRVTGIFD